MIFSDFKVSVPQDESKSESIFFKLSIKKVIEVKVCIKDNLYLYVYLNRDNTINIIPDKDRTNWRL